MLKIAWHVNILGRPSDTYTDKCNYVAFVHRLPLLPMQTTSDLKITSQKLITLFIQYISVATTIITHYTYYVNVKLNDEISVKRRYLRSPFRYLHWYVHSRCLREQVASFYPCKLPRTSKSYHRKLITSYSNNQVTHILLLWNERLKIACNVDTLVYVRQDLCDREGLHWGRCTNKAPLLRLMYWKNILSVILFQVIELSSSSCCSACDEESSCNIVSMQPKASWMILLPILECLRINLMGGVDSVFRTSKIMQHYCVCVRESR